MRNEGINKKKLAVLVRNFSPHSGGAEKYCFELTLELKKFFEVYVFCQEYSERLEGIKFYKVPKLKRPRFLNQIFFSIATYIYTRIEHFEIIHSHEMVTFANVQSIHVPTVKSSVFHQKKFLEKFLVLLSPRLLSYLFLEKGQMRIFSGQKKAIVAVSSLNKKNIEDSYPKTKGYLHIASPAIKLNNIDQAIKINVFEKYKIPDDAQIIIFVGHNFKRKGLQVLIDACEKIKHICPWVLVVGRDNPESVFFSSSESKSRTIFLGEILDIGPFYSKANVIVHPTLGDTYGMAILEAMYYQTTPIISNEKYCGIASELNEFNSIKLKDPFNSSELSQALLSFFNDKEMSLRLSKNARIFAKNKTWEKVALKFCSIYDEII